MKTIGSVTGNGYNNVSGNKFIFALLYHCDLGRYKSAKRICAFGVHRIFSPY